MTTVDDYIDKSRAQWAQIAPELETEPAGIVGRIMRIAHVIELRSERVLEDLGVTRSEFDILSLLVRTGRPMTPSELATQALCSAAGVTKRLKKLVDSGMVTREANPSDGRGALITLTDKAREKMIPILQAVLDAEADLISVIPPEEREPLAAQLRTLLSSLEAAGSR
ncbi:MULTISPECIES: MarR family transcriptional regulator [unclassified Diaminobutyricimonas]|uniref:MarR family winged helix-turn-helix transcriptional regulator n=1 Tax=unclassified Diaminobutyricimonas TaxID=2643261 RepID=UPI0012F4E35F|nr:MULTISPECIES: MarR family transcriptional regulator [unclassified Diaminobutyricimonas]